MRFRFQITAGARLLATAFLGFVAPFALAQPAVPTFTNVSVHDPSIVRDGAMYYVFGSHLASASSPDLMHWTQISTAPTADNPLIPNPQVELQEALTWAQTNTFWAPDVIKLADGRYRFYYCACRGDAPLSALGIAVADAITGPYKNQGIILKSGMVGPGADGLPYDHTVDPNVVDPSVFFDATGKLWMVYGSYSGGIFILALDPATGVPLPGQGYGKKLTGGNDTTIEGPYILYSPDTQYYYLFMTYGGLDANGGYNIRMGRSRNPDGPYLDSEGNDLTNVKGAPGTLFDNTSIAPYAVKLMGNCQFLHVTGEPGAVTPGYVSPGGTSAYYNPDNGKYVLVFHTRFVGLGEYHEVRVHQMYLNADGWFVVSPHRYAQETMTTTVPGEVPGDYKLINHGKDVTPTVVNSTLVTLQPDGSVTGASSGTWAVTGDHDATLTLDGTTYHGVFAPAWDDDAQRWVLTFTALSTHGVAVWGSKVATATAVVPPAITTPPADQTVAVGQSATFAVEAAGSPSYQWRHDGVAIAGATSSAYAIASVKPADTGAYEVTITNALGAVTSTAGVLTVPPPPQVAVPNGDGTAHIVNLSARGIVSTGEDVLIAGFAIAGPSPKKLLIQCSGLTLHQFGLPEIGRPLMSLTHVVDGKTVTLAQNDDWQTVGPELTTLREQTSALQLTPSTDPAHGDAAMIVTLPPGLYSVVVSPDPQSANQEGVGLIELYDASPADGSRLINISARGRVETGSRQMIVGVSIAGTGHDRLMVRGIGPTLQAFGITRALANPSEVFRELTTQQVVAANDDWWYSAQADQTATLGPKIGAFQLGPHAADAVVLTLVAADSYTAVIAPSDGQPGVAMAEIYDANE